MTPLIISIAAFLGVAALVGGVALLLRGPESSKLEDRLDMLAGHKHPTAGKENALQSSLLATLEQPNYFELLVKRMARLSTLFEQADTRLTPSRFFAISGGLALAGMALPLASGISAALAPVLGITFGLLPLIWLMMRRKRRLKAFASQLPDALELISRALRAGHSLAAGMDLVRAEMGPPIAIEFGRVFEEQNLGIPLDDALRSMIDRMPNLDLKFFVTAVVLQRQTGGDLAEILDKIGYLIRERFKIWGQVQALTGEGRLSGIVLLALPPLLFLAVYYLNPEYCMVLFRDPLGMKMLAGAVFLQIVGALVIKKIVNIKV
jgi:tight adherence protein B